MVIVSPSSTDIVFPVMVLEKDIDGIRSRNAKSNKIGLFRFIALEYDLSQVEKNVV